MLTLSHIVHFNESCISSTFIPASNEIVLAGIQRIGCPGRWSSNKVK